MSAREAADYRAARAVTARVVKVALDSPAAIFERYADALLAFATGLVGPSDAPDVVSAAFMKALWSPSWSGVRNPGAYLHRCVLNEARRLQRDAMRRRGRELRAAVASGVPVVTMPELHPEVLEAVGLLSFRQRAVVFLTYWNGLPPAEVATYLAISEGSVRRHLARARAKLRELLDV